MKELEKYIKSVKDRENNLVKRISVKDREISDIYHYIELTDTLNIADSYKIYQMLKDRLEEVRAIKDEMYVLQPFIRFVDNIELDSLKESVTDRKIQLKNRTYTVKQLNDIFGEYIGGD